MRSEDVLGQEPTKYLNKLISLAGRATFREAVDQGTLADYFHNLTGFAVASGQDIGLDQEGRLFGSKISFENRILDVRDIDIRDSREIHLFNCVILGDLHIASHQGIHLVYIDNCLILGILSIAGNDQDAEMKVLMWNSNCTILRVNSSQIKEIDVGASNIHDCEFVNTRCESLLMTSNQIQFFRLEDFEVVHCDFSHSQVNLAKSFPSGPVRRVVEANDINWQDRSNVLLDFSLGANVHSESTFETLAFLRNRTLIGGD